MARSPARREADPRRRDRTAGGVTSPLLSFRMTAIGKANRAPRFDSRQFVAPARAIVHHVRPEAVLWTPGQDFPRGDIHRGSARSPSQARRQRRTKTNHKPPVNRSNRTATMPNVMRPVHGSTGKDTLPLRLMLVVNCRTPGPKAIQSVASAQEVTSNAARTRRKRPRPGGVSITAPPKANTAPAPAPGMASEDHPLAES